MNSPIKNMKKQKGFTLIEIAIVLVIIGLLVGGVLQGQELIENSRVKQAAKDMNGTAAAMFAYQDRYKRLPGDDGGTLSARGAAWATVVDGNLNGLIDASLADTFTGILESGGFWQQLRAAGFIAGNPADLNQLALPVNAWGGFMGVTTAAMGVGLEGTKVCLSQVPGSSALALDNELDDGLGATGNLRATLGVSATNTFPSNSTGPVYNEDLVYTVCYRI